MLRRPALVFLILLSITGGCRQEPEDTTTASSEEAFVEATAPPPPPEVRSLLDEINPAIPLWQGARATHESVREQGSSTIIDLQTNDPFPMVWHYYVTYLAQYRAWDPLKPYPPRSEEGRNLQLELNEVMKDPFVPGTALEPGAAQVTLIIREDPTRNIVNIRYVVGPPAPEQEAAPESDE